MEDVAAHPLIDAHLTVLRRNIGVINQNLEGLSQEQTLIPFTAGGSHFNWLLSHLISTRDSILTALGSEPQWSEETRASFGVGSTAPDADNALPLERLRADLEESQRHLEHVLPTVTEAHLAAPSGRSTVGQRLEFLVWHESYHIGQTSIYRRLAGLERALP